MTMVAFITVIERDRYREVTYERTSKAMYGIASSLGMFLER